MHRGVSRKIGYVLNLVSHPIAIMHQSKPYFKIENFGYKAGHDRRRHGLLKYKWKE